MQPFIQKNLTQKPLNFRTQLSTETGSEKVVDTVSKSEMTTTQDAGIWGYDGIERAADTAILLSNGIQVGGAAYSQLVPKSESTADWTGSGPWTRSIDLDVAGAGLGVYTVSTDLAGATITITAGTATIDAGASATFGAPDQFEVTGTGTVTITTDTADPKAQLTKSTYKLPYATNTTAGTLSVPHNYADATHGTKSPIEGELLDALDGKAEGDEVAVNGDFSSWLGGDPTGWDIIGEVGTDPEVSEVGFGNFHGGAGTGACNIYTSTGALLFMLPSTAALTIGKTYQITLDVDANTGTLKITSYSSATIYKTGITTGNNQVFRFVATETSYRISRDVGATDVTIDNVSIQKVSPAKGRMIVEWTPQWDTADVSGNIDILSFDGSDTGGMYYDADNSLLKVYDGTNTAEKTLAVVDGTKYSIELNYDSTGMQITIDSGTPGTKVNFAGSFPITGDEMSMAWAADHPAIIGSIKIYKEPSW